MFLTLKELQLRPIQFDLDLAAGEINYVRDLTQESPLHAEGEAVLVNVELGEIRVRGTFSVNMAAPCDRCLEPARVSLRDSFDSRFFPADQFEEEGGERAIDGEAADISYYRGDRLDLNDILREAVLLALPMQLVCGEDCKGICPSCGQNRNLKDCDCKRAPVDDRWSKLATLRSELGH